jgi:hypothetical protein
MAFITFSLAGVRPVVLLIDDALDNPGARDNFPPGPEGDQEHAAAVEKFSAIWEEYERTYDTSILPIREGRQVTKFMVASLTERQAAHVANMHAAKGFGEAQLEHIAYAVHDIVPFLELDQKSGEVVAKPLKRVKDKLGDRLPPVAMAMFQDPILRQYLYSACRIASSVPPEVRKRH